jgi:hypothetical protein
VHLIKRCLSDTLDPTSLSVYFLSARCGALADTATPVPLSSSQVAMMRQNLDPSFSCVFWRCFRMQWHLNIIIQVQNCKTKKRLLYQVFFVSKPQVLEKKNRRLRQLALTSLSLSFSSPPLSLSFLTSLEETER